MDTTIVVAWCRVRLRLKVLLLVKMALVAVVLLMQAVESEVAEP